MADRELGRLIVRVDLDNTKFDSGVAGLNRQLKLAQSEFKASSQVLNGFGKNTDNLKLQSESLTKQMELQSQKVQLLKKRYDESVVAQGADTKATQAKGVALNKAVADLAKMENELKQVNKSIDIQNSAWTRSAETLNRFSDRLGSAGEHMSNVGAAMTAGITLPALAVGAAAIKSSIDFESAFAGVRKTVNATEEEFTAFRTGIINMSKEIPVAADEIARVAESAGQLGVQKSSVLDFTRTMVDLGVSTNLSADEAANALARLANITQMPQSEFDRLGATIVALGNAGASTESDITDMALRIAGAGHQINLSEADIVSFASALSSVGINAESGGSSISRVMIEIANAVSSGGKNLKTFADIAGQSSAQFQKSFKTDASGAIVSFIEGLGKMKKDGENVFPVLKDLGLGEIQVRDALLRASGAGDLFRKSLELGSKAWNENTALTNEASQRYKTTASQLQILQNRLVAVGIELGDALAPALLDALNAMEPLFTVIKNLAEGFANLDPATQKVVLTIGALAIAAGPVLAIIGPMASGASVVAGWFTAAAESIAVAGGAAAVAGTAFAAMTGPIGLTVIGLAALAAGGIMFADMMSEKAIPNTDLFGEKVSSSTKKAVSAYLDLDQKASVAMDSLAFSGETVTQGMANKITGIVEQMTNKIVDSLQKQKDQTLQQMNDFFAQTDALSATKEQQILQKTNSDYTKRIQATKQGETQIKQIYDKAAQDHRTLTTQEETQVQTIKTRMRTQAVQTLTASEQEQKVILERMKTNHGILAATEAAQVVQESKKAKDGVVKEANAKYNQTIAWATRERDQNKTISAADAKAVIDKAKEKRDQSVKHAQDQHNKVVGEAKKQAKEHASQVDWETGQVKSKWQTLSDNVVSIAKGIGDSITAIDWAGIGASIVSGLRLGIDSGSTSLASHASALAGSIAGSMQARLDINSPSRVMMAIGGSVGEGLSLGIQNSIPQVSKQAVQMANAAISTPTPQQQLSQGLNSIATKIQGNGPVNTVNQTFYVTKPNINEDQLMKEAQRAARMFPAWS